MENQKQFDGLRPMDDQSKTVFPVVQEQATIQKEVIESATVKIKTSVIEVEKNIDIPLLQEGYDVQRIPINQFVEKHPAVREEGDTIIVPVVREVLVVEKRLELVEELHIIKKNTTVNHKESFTLKKEEVRVERIPVDRDKK